MERNGKAVLMLAGDVMTGRGVDQVLMHPGDPTLHESYVRDARDYVRLAEAASGPIEVPVAADYVWGAALAEMERVAPDLRIVNLETAVTGTGEPWPGKGIHYRMHPANVDCLRAAHIDACALANNHVLDWGAAGLLETLQTLHDAGVQVAGAGIDADAAWAPARLPLPTSLPRCGKLLLFSVAVSSSGVPDSWAAGQRRPGVALLPDLSASTTRVLAEDIARRRGAGDLVVVSIHWGGNWGLAVPLAHRDFAHRLIDAGAADVVHGHSSHHPLPVEVYQGRLILYGCGDLINDYEGIGAHRDLRSDIGCLYFVTLHAGSGCLDTLEIVPLQLKRLRLSLADATAHDWLREVFRDGSAGLGEQPSLRGEGRWILRTAVVH
ncbi:MAG: CapA family protein [Burkholderiaceae bacterium]|nr:CapA family protein [Burkholderiaceae bacterium]